MFSEMIILKVAGRELDDIAENNCYYWELEYRCLSSNVNSIFSFQSNVHTFVINIVSILAYLNWNTSRYGFPMLHGGVLRIETAS